MSEVSGSRFNRGELREGSARYRWREVDFAQSKKMPTPKSRITTQGPVKRNLWALLILIAIAALLLFWNRYTFLRDVSLATGPPTPAQRQFFESLVSRPDLPFFFKDLSRPEKLAMAKNLGLHDDPNLAGLIGRLLENFDPDVRRELTQSLISLARKQPEPVSNELARGSSFQIEAVFTAMKAAAPKSIPNIFARLDSPPHRANAIRLLVELGPIVVADAMKALDSQNEDVRRASAEILAKLRIRAASKKLESLYRSAQGDAKLDYLSAIARIGNPSSAPLLQSAFLDPNSPKGFHEQAALGLGVLGDDQSLNLLVRAANSEQRLQATMALEGLRLASDAALKQPLDERTQVEVARVLHTALADATLAKVVSNTSNREILKMAIPACAERPLASKAVAQRMAQMSPDRDGDLITEAVNALLSTREGTAQLSSIGMKSPLYGFIERGKAILAP